MPDKKRATLDKLYRLSILMRGSIGEAIKEVSLRPPPRSVYGMDDAALGRRLDACLRDWRA